jgi:PIN domain nuclease of toxin-antitoxin system
MRLLLDTHALIWFVQDADRLPKAAKDAVETAAEVYASAASLWEMTTKHRAGKLPEIGPLLADYESVFAKDDIRPLPIDLRHAALAGGMDGEHKDPFDRILCAQALVEDLVLVSADKALDAFGVIRLWDAA